MPLSDPPAEPPEGRQLVYLVSDIVLPAVKLADGGAQVSPSGGYATYPACHGADIIYPVIHLLNGSVYVHRQQIESGKIHYELSHVFSPPFSRVFCPLVISLPLPAAPFLFFLYVSFDGIHFTFYIGSGAAYSVIRCRLFLLHLVKISG